MTSRAPALAALAVTLTFPLAPTVHAQPGRHASAGEGTSCFLAREADNFAAQGPRAVNVRVGVDRYYRLDLFNPCPNLDFTMSIAMRSRGSDWICQGTNNDVEIYDRSGPIPEHCLVTRVTRLTPAEVAALPMGAKP
ncbi:MAG: DUF6491 family protein [Caulobacteraceae bacterium]